MVKRFMVFMLVAAFIGVSASAGAREVEGVSFPDTKLVQEKNLALNGTAVRKALGFVKVFVAGLYLENPTRDSGQAIDSQQVKHLYVHYLTNKATAKKLQEGFIEGITKANDPEKVAANMADIQKYASWLDLDMQPGFTTESVYVPGKGLTLLLNGVEKGTLENPEFITLYYRYYLGDKADKKIRDGLLGL